ncbi:MAG: homoserine dehydrogenase [Bacteroidetes bacterium]|nr:homoserine dehydrogenase [Bacteroidota bacterium]
MENKKISLGLFGFGCVGQGLYDVLNQSQSLEASIEKICVKDRNKTRRLDANRFTYDKKDILSRKDLDVVVELISDTDAAFEIVSTAMKNGVSVVSASKEMLAKYFPELYKLQQQNNVSLIYEGSVGGSIPILRNLEEYYDNELLQSVRAILNGTCNYILTRMELEGKDYSEILKDAQASGFAEADPWLDVSGCDAKYKILLIAVHAFGLLLKPEQIMNLGIQNVRYEDILYAKEKGLRIKLLTRAEKIGDKYRVYVMPHFIDKTSELFNVLYEYNAVEVEGAFSCKQTFTGKGAGSHPTGSAVLSDISALTYNYRYGYKKLKKFMNGNGSVPDSAKLLDTDFKIKVYVRFSNKSEIEKLEIVSIEEEYKSAKNNYIIATVNFKSLFHFAGNKNSKVFICAI